MAGATKKAQRSLSKWITPSEFPQISILLGLREKPLRALREINENTVSL